MHRACNVHLRANNEQLWVHLNNETKTDVSGERGVGGVLGGSQNI